MYATAPSRSRLCQLVRGTTLFVAPLMEDPPELFLRLLATEPGVANLYLAHELKNGGATKAPPPAVASWIELDLAALSANVKLDGLTARIYRGTQVVREDV